MNQSTTKIYFKVNWIFNDGRSSPTNNDRIFSVDISNEILKSLPNLMEDDDRIHLSAPIFEAFKREFLEFNEEEYMLEVLDGFGENLVLSLHERGEDQFGLQSIIYWHLKDAKPIPLRIVQRVGPKHSSSAADKTHLGLLRECHRVIKEILFRCSQCQDYKLNVSGKHPKHNTITRCSNTDHLNDSCTTKEESFHPNLRTLLEKLKAMFKEQSAEIGRLKKELAEAKKNQRDENLGYEIVHMPENEDELKIYDVLHHGDDDPIPLIEDFLQKMLAMGF